MQETPIRNSQLISQPSRRDFLALSAACGTRLALGSALAAWPAGRLFADGKVVAEKPWGRIEEIAEGIWAVISTPLADGNYTTLCNGGIVAGDKGVLIVEGFARPEGAAWVVEKAKELTGKAPSDVVVTHFHGDHVNGLAGFFVDGKGPRVWSTAKTVELVRETDASREGGPDADRAAVLDRVETLDPGKPTELDLGDRKVLLHPRGGHTPSDVTIELESPSVVFFGDLVWNEMFPNYRDATPSKLSASVRAALRDESTVYVPGHGPLSDAAATETFLKVIDDIERVARKAHADGVAAADAAAGYEMPAPATEWTLFRETYFEVAIGAWLRELGG